MSSTINPIQLYGGIIGPNPLKVAIVLTLLKLPFEIVPVPFAKVKEPEYEAINPNGRLPSIHDPTADLTIWESGAIIEYLIERYDTKEPRKLSFTPGSAEAELARSFLHLQASGQGPYYGQVYWFKKLHAERIPSAVKRYVDEAKRVTGVLDKWLGKQKAADDKDIGDGPWLVGNKFSYADVAFMPWQRTARVVFADDGFDVDEFPNEKEWFEHMISKKPIEEIPRFCG
ncbi:Glutathione S-transferase Ure2-like, putative [Penicillium digitatum]|uniref:Glutathione S-transferase Ure2-like, putative n=3 Tax=Penicillium digitatum TaxID=36651 RepID=K9G0P3_PEND2|nr:Glutathione S-transferase Ure2-like, putative [Penicillium digitatum Pd1]EKV06690.1 Glutathione S-transferase Ure2-like, putative [Penicillium digitatum Pd1]EKV08463.1 Glutathione S-transferase Ure2-like, putative [Penicillium digitatum PHI26]KAG0159634.1 hypothetical protein PDIDSM_7156 [Penicillium digitatum]QQK40868.1 Glutathione S-transferase Ure2-like, putative [Penicillium digitatum]